jgi:putative phage-type endonuclease
MTSAALETGDLPYHVICDSKDEARWKAARKLYIGASESPTVLGANKYGSALELWAVKTGQIPEPDLSGKEPVFWGHRLEEPIIEGFSERTGRFVVPFGLMLASTRYPWLAATPDALTTNDPDAAKHTLVIARTVGHLKTALKKGVSTANLVQSLRAATVGWWPLQIKNVGARMADDWVEGVPASYRIQCMHEAIVFGASQCTGAALITGSQLAWEDISVDESAAQVQQLVNLTRGFLHRNIRGKVKPPIDGSESAGRALSLLYPQEKPETVLRLDVDYLELAQERDELVHKRGDAEKRIKEIDHLLLDAMGTNERAMFPDGSGFTFKTTRVKEFVMPARENRIPHRVKKPKEKK